MTGSDRIFRLTWLFIIMAFLLPAGPVVPAMAQEPALAALIKTHHDDKGWKLLLNGENYFVKGVVWSYTPIGESYAYNLWSKPDNYIRKVLDYDCVLMKEAGINTIRTFSNIPPAWIEYIYTKYGIMTIVNHQAGRYGFQVGGAWHPQTDYSDPQTRTAIKNDILKQVKILKNTPGVLLFALGNENNYGLEWSSSFEIENLPGAERHRAKAKFLYSMYNEIIAEAKKIDSDRLFTIVNGDLQYVDLIAEQCKDIDLLGVNAYRGKSFTTMWKTAREKLNKPILLMEFGSDAYNARTDLEDQASQAAILKDNWEEIYQNSYGNDAAGNALGGCVFEWRDEWWKYKQTENLEIHDRVASWANGGYASDYVPGENNMNEEWFGVVTLEALNGDGVAEARPRMAYYTLQQIFRINPYGQDVPAAASLAASKIDPQLSSGSLAVASAATATVKNGPALQNSTAVKSGFDSIDMPRLAYESDVRSLKQSQAQDKWFYLAGGNIRTQFVDTATGIGVQEKGKNAQNYSTGLMGFLDFGFRPSSMLFGDFSINYINSIPSSQKTVEKAFYGYSRSPNSVELYNLNATLKTDIADITTFYHVPRYHWGHEGDFYGLLWEATDINGIDVWDGKAPFGVEFAGKNQLEGLKIVTGPEVYWGANPKFMAKYYGGTDTFKYAIMHSEDIAQTSTAAATGAISRTTRASTVYVKTTAVPDTTIEIGAISAASERIGDQYNYLNNGTTTYGNINFGDTLGIKAKVTYQLTDNISAYGGVNYAGLVANGGNPLRDFDSMLPYSQYGNKIEADGGVRITMGPEYSLFPRIFWRDNLKAANPYIAATSNGTVLYPGMRPRNNDADPFAVTDNRAARSAELIFTYDPTPITDFYHWDWKREDASFAYNIGFNYTNNNAATDSWQYYDPKTKSNSNFPYGLTDARVWKAMSRMIFNPTSTLKIRARIEGGHQQSTGDQGAARTYFSEGFDIDYANRHTLSGYIKQNAWGPYDYYQQFNQTYPRQYKLDYMYRLDHLLHKHVPERPGKSAGIGVYGIIRTLDSNSPADEYLNGKNNYDYEVNMYLTYEF